MGNLYRKPSDEQLRFARRPLDQHEAERVNAYQDRKKAIWDYFQREINLAGGGFQGAPKGHGKSPPRSSDPRDRHTTAESRALEKERDRKLEQLKKEFQGAQDIGMFTAASKEWSEFSASSPYKAAKYTREAASYAADAAKLAAGASLYSNPVTAGLAIASEVDKWLGRAIGWVQMVKKKWDADCSRISVRTAKLIRQSYSDSKLNKARAGSDKSTLTRQRYEKLLYQRVFKIREETIKYKIREHEVSAEAQNILEQKQLVELKVHNLSQLDFSGSPHAPKLKKMIQELTQKCLKLSEKIMNLLNEVTSNCSRLVNQAQVNVDRMVNDLVQSYSHWIAKGKFTGAHGGAWHDPLRRLL